MSLSSAALARSVGVAEDDDYAKLSYYLRQAVTDCGVNVLDPSAYEDVANQKVNILMLALGKQFGLESLSYKTVFLDDSGSILAADEPAKHISIAEAVHRHGLEVDPMFLGGMIPVQPTHVIVCSLDWVRTFYAEPAKRIKQQKQSPGMAGGPGHRLGSTSDGNDTSNHASGGATQPMVSNDEIRALFVRNSTMAAMEEDVRDMTSKLQGLIAAKRQAKASSSNDSSFQSFSGQGQSLGSTTNTSATAQSSAEGIVWDSQTLPDKPSPFDSSAKTTSIAVRLLDGSRKIIKMNSSHTVQDLAAYCQQALPGAGHVPWMSERFVLVAGFPPKPLSDGGVSIDKAGLAGAQVSMKRVD